MNLIDTHCHYNLEPLWSTNGGWQTHWQAAQAAGVSESIVVGTSLASSQRALDISASEKKLHAAVGLHPAEVSQFGIDSTADVEQAVTAELEKLIQLIKNTEQQPVAIGEIGYDYFHYQRSYADATEWQHFKVAQQLLVTKQLELAAELNLPALLHVRSTDDTAYWDTLDALKAVQLSKPFVLHCASGPLTYISDALELGAYISIAGNVTYKNADAIRAIVTLTPKDRLLIETDAPYLPPTPHRGKMCEPAMIQLTAQYLEQELQVDLDQVYANTKEVFSL